MAYYQQPNNNRAPSHARQPSIATLSEQLELNLSLRNVPKMDLMSPSDPFIIVKVKDEARNVWNVVGKTDIIWDNPNPDFSNDIRINYMFEQIQHVRLDIWDANEQQTKDLSKHDYIGYVDFVVGDLVTSSGQKLAIAIKDKGGRPLKKVNGMQPIAIVRAQEVDENYDEVEFEFAATGLPKMDWFGKIDPFFQIYRQTNDGQWASVYKSEHYKSTYKPNWKRFRIESRRLCHGDMNRPILIRCWDWNRDAEPDYACEVRTTLASLIDVKSMQWKQWDAKKNKYKSKNCGQLFIRYSNIIKKYSFTSFLSGGLQIQLMVAIDFTGSNGDPRDEKSLHYMGPPYYESQYMKVIKSVGRVLEPYDADGQIAAYGFGANLNPYGKQISHCFNVTLDPDKEEVDGIDGLVEAYKTCLTRVQLYGPTYFAEILQNAAAKSMGVCDQKTQQYNILLIITDGVINDMQRSIDSIVDATALPLSIIIVGVGDADFTNMDILDADDEPLRHSQTRKLMQRDIVQFVPFNEFKNSHMSVIAKETLEEVPGQVTSFMAMHDISPNPPRHAKQATVDNIYGAVAVDADFDPNANNPYMKQASNYPNLDDQKEQDFAPAAFAYGANPQYSEGGITQQPGGGGGGGGGGNA
eukprot:CAMPEP_0197029822 /NCGR_PEP_ID=MMETSP1384-20130603/9187_1 /TAXON_ID=29189 /ORGANISM="Ammonia sp." /LENGTH=636 /DNA_ID=CAMNT_0042459059 /DNA_START=16 /DNA_END=1922 /DNA_ORIENTATION=-